MISCTQTAVVVVIIVTDLYYFCVCYSKSKFLYAILITLPECIMKGTCIIFDAV